MTTAARAKRRIAIPAGAEVPVFRGPIDIRTEGRATTVTVDLPAFLLAELRWEITPSSVIIRSADAARILHVIIPLSEPVLAQRFVILATGTIFDIRMERQEP